MIITDPAIDYHGKFKQCSHMCSDLPGIEGSRELMAFARKIGMRPEWIQKPGIIPLSNQTERPDQLDEKLLHFSI